MAGIRGALYPKLAAALGAAVVVPLLAYAAVSAWYDWRELRAALERLHTEQAGAAAQRIDAFVQDLEAQLRWATHLPWDGGPVLPQKQLDAARTLKAAPAVTDLALVDGLGRERVHVSRLTLNRAGQGPDRSGDRAVREALRLGSFHGPVVFRRETEPYMLLAVAGEPRSHGVAVAQVNLKHIWDIVAGLRIGRSGLAYVVDGQGRLIAHPDISLVLRNTDASALLARLDAPGGGRAGSRVQAAAGLGGGPALLAQAATRVPGWRVIVELPRAEADEPLLRALWRAALITALGLALAALGALALARRLLRPVLSLTQGAGRIGAGALEHRIEIRTGDELETLGREFNAMAQRLQASHAQLEQRIAERTQELAEANQAMARFLAAASHDLRQPLHALNLLVAQWRATPDAAQRSALGQRVEWAVEGINRLFEDLMDLSKLDAGAVACDPLAFPVNQLLDRVEEVFGLEARRQGLRWRVCDSQAWVRSDPALLERILFNLVANAIRYTPAGAVLVGCRRRGDQLRIDVLDSGVGMSAAEQSAIFREFYQAAPPRRLGASGLGLGLAIVSRLARLLGHEVSVLSEPGRGTRFSVAVPLAAPAPLQGLPAGLAAVPSLQGLRVALLDDDAQVLETTRGVLESWGCQVEAAADVGALLAARAAASVPDLVIADHHLGPACDGVQAVALLRAVLERPQLPAFILSADAGDEVQAAVRSAGLFLLRKPASPMALRAMISHALRPAEGPAPA